MSNFVNYFGINCCVFRSVRNKRKDEPIYEMFSSEELSTDNFDNTQQTSNFNDISVWHSYLLYYPQRNFILGKELLVSYGKCCFGTLHNFYFTIKLNESEVIYASFCYVFIIC